MFRIFRIGSGGLQFPVLMGRLVFHAVFDLQCWGREVVTPSKTGGASGACFVAMLSQVKQVSPLMAAARTADYRLVMTTSGPRIEMSEGSSPYL